MKISIDTKDESREDIRKLIRLLQHIVDGTEHSENLGGSSSSGYVNIFGDDPKPSGPQTPSEPAAPGIFSIFDNPPKSEDSEETEPETIDLEGSEEDKEDDEKQGSAKMFTYN